MLLKSQEISLKKKEFFKGKVILLYGENQDLINDLNEQIVFKFIDEKKISKSFFEEDIIKNPENIINHYLNGSLFDENKNISIVKSCSDKILEIIKLTVSYQFQDKNGVVIYQDAITKDKRVSVTDNLSNNMLVKNNEKKLLLDSIIQNILFKSKVSLN